MFFYIKEYKFKQATIKKVKFNNFFQSLFYKANASLL